MIDPEVVSTGPGPDPELAAADDVIDEARTLPADVAEGRGAAALDLSGALALEAAQKAVNCPTPPAAQAVIEAAEAARPEEVAELRKAIGVRQAAGRRKSAAPKSRSAARSKE